MNGAIFKQWTRARGAVKSARFRSELRSRIRPYIEHKAGGQSRNLSARNRVFTAPDRGATIGATIGAMIGATPGHRLAVDGPELSLVTRNFRSQVCIKAVATNFQSQV